MKASITLSGSCNNTLVFSEKILLKEYFITNKFKAAGMLFNRYTDSKISTKNHKKHQLSFLHISLLKSKEDLVTALPGCTRTANKSTASFACFQFNIILVYLMLDLISSSSV